jgi:hypothetical protein
MGIETGKRLSIFDCPWLDCRRFLIQSHYTTILVLILPVTKADRVSNLQPAPIQRPLLCGGSDVSLYNCCT